MLILNKRAFFNGMALMVSFLIVLWIIFTPIFPGPGGTKITGIDYLDGFFNSLSKGSADYFGVVRASGRKFVGTKFSATIKPKKPENAAKFADMIANAGRDVPAEIQLKAQIKDGKVVIQTTDLLPKGNQTAGAPAPQLNAQVQGGTIVIQSDGPFIANAGQAVGGPVRATVKDGSVIIEGDDLFEFARVQIRDAEAMYRNDSAMISATHNGMDAKFVMESWWEINSLVFKSLQASHNYNEAKFVNSINTRAIEPAFNFYGIEAKKVSEHALLTTAILSFYILYTMWYGFAIFEICAGFGLTMKKPKEKHEV